MPKFDKPDSPNIIWGVNALDANLTKPSDSYIQTGWTRVKPPYEYENYSMNKLHQGLAYYNQLGIPEWDSVTEYQAGKSYVQGSNNRVYKCIQTHTNRNPATAGNEAYWKLFESEILGTGIFSAEQFIGNIPFFQAGVKTDLKVQVVRQFFQGLDPDDIRVVSTTFPESFSNACIAVLPVGEDAGLSEGSEYNIGVISKSTTGASFRLQRQEGGAPSSQDAYVRYLAVGY